MTPREVFDKVKAHLLAQNARSGVSGACKYRAPDGNKCAVGCLIADEHYSDELEGKSCRCDSVIAALVRSGVDAVANENLLGELQRLHDSVPVVAWADYLDGIEERHFDDEAGEA